MTVASEIREFIEGWSQSPVIDEPRREDFVRWLTWWDQQRFEGRKVDTNMLALLIESAEWLPRPDYGEGVTVAWHAVGYNQLTDALDWSCASCRDEVGWPDWNRIEKSAQGEITMHVECGHCGALYRYDETGEVLDES